MGARKCVKNVPNELHRFVTAKVNGTKPSWTKLHSSCSTLCASKFESHDRGNIREASITEILQVQYCSVMFSTVFVPWNLIKFQNFAEAQITRPQFRGDGFLRRLIPISLSANQRLEIAMRLSIAHSSTLSNATLFYAFSDNEVNPSVKMDLVNQTAIRLTLVCGAGSPPLALTVQRPNAAPSSAGEDFTTITFRWVRNQREIFSFEHQSRWELSHNLTVTWLDQNSARTESSGSHRSKYATIK